MSLKMSDLRWGWVKDRPDPRDFSARSLVYAAMPLPSTFSCVPKPMVYNQGGYPACVGFASAGTKSDEEFIQYKTDYMFDGLWLYKECKKVDGISNMDGTFPRVALGILREYGMRQLTLPCNKEVLKDDAVWKIKGYYRIGEDSSVDFIKQIIFQYGTILSASWWYESWNGIKDVFPEPENKCGGHAYRIAGWDNTGFVVVNSWGKDLWGVKGIATMPYDIFMSTVLPEGDVWKLIDL